uniref:Uncharacterized protein n=1 Tax=Glossina palpalis gambiensis TaxID=67801 RepID=A0A1B0C417_9MUSC
MPRDYGDFYPLPVNHAQTSRPPLKAKYVLFCKKKNKSYLTFFKSSLGPTPLKRRICGEFTAPPLTITSFLTKILRILPYWSITSTPNTVLVFGCIRTLVTVVFNKICKLLRCRAGRKKERAELQRIPFREKIFIVGFMSSSLTGYKSVARAEPASKTFHCGISDKREATTEPAEPPPTTIKSYS